jgi:addiction module HigA family antidote
MRVIHPGEVLKKEIIEANGLTITEAANLPGVTRTYLSNITNEKSDISPEMAYRILMAFGGTAEIWANLQTKFNLQKAEKKIKAFRLNIQKSLYILNQSFTQHIFPNNKPFLIFRIIVENATEIFRRSH